MTTIRETLVVTTDETPLDLLLWRHFKREIPGLVERTYALNQNLAAKGSFLPLGTRVVVEIEAPLPAPAPVRLVRLMD